MNIRKKYNKKLRRNNSILTSYCLVKNTRIRDFFYTATTILRRYKDEVGKSMKIALSECPYVFLCNHELVPEVLIH